MHVLLGYHGTNAQFTKFDARFSGTGGLVNAEYGEVYFFSKSAEIALDYAHCAVLKNGGIPTVMEARLTLSHPLVFDFAKDARSVLNIDEDSLDDDVLVQDELINLARQLGHDGLLFTNFNDGGKELITQYAVFTPTQIEIL